MNKTSEDILQFGAQREKRKLRKKNQLQKKEEFGSFNGIEGKGIKGF